MKKIGGKSPMGLGTPVPLMTEDNQLMKPILFRVF